MFWTAAALLGALLLQTALTQIAPGHARVLDPFLIVIVYCGLTGGEVHGMLAGAAGGWIQDIHFGGTVLGLAGLTKVLLGFGVGVASTRFHLVEAAPRGLVLFLATAADALIYLQLARCSTSPPTRSPGRIVRRAVIGAVMGVAAYELVERRRPVVRGAREDLRGPDPSVATQRHQVGWWGPGAARDLLAPADRAGHFRELAENNRIRAVPIPAPRGPIFDRNGRVLVENRSSFNVVLSAEPHANLDSALERVGRLIEVDEDQVRDRIDGQGPRFKSVVIKSDASDEDVAVVESRRLEEPEVGVEVVPLRAYPLTLQAAHVLGRVGEITDRQLASTSFAGIESGTTVGQAGLEAQYNRALMAGRRAPVRSTAAASRWRRRSRSPGAGAGGDPHHRRGLQRAMEAKGGRLSRGGPRPGRGDPG